MITWTVTKALHGHLEGIAVTEPVTADATLGPPFTAGQRVSGIGGDYTVTSVEKVVTRVRCVTHSAVFPAGWEDGHRSGPLGEQNTTGACAFEPARDR